jgi:hypothetical protein
MRKFSVSSAHGSDFVSREPYQLRAIRETIPGVSAAQRTVNRQIGKTLGIKMPIAEAQQPPICNLCRELKEYYDCLSTKVV